MILQLDNLGSGGIIYDTPAFELPLAAFSDGQNVRLHDNAVERTLGYEDVFTAPSVVPYWLMPWQTATTYYWFYFGTAKIRRTDGSTDIDVTRTTGGDYSPGSYPRWNGGVLGGVPVANHSNLGNDFPQEWNDSTSKFQDMATWPMGGGDPTWYTKVLRVYKNFLLALYMQEDSVVYPTRLRWNHPTDPGAYPGEWIPASTNLAGTKTFSDTTAPLVDCLPMKDIDIVYKEDSVHLMQYVGGNYVFDFKQAFGEFGLLSQRCVKSFFGKHFLVSFDDVIVHDGQTAQSVADKTTRRALFALLDSDNYQNTFVVTKVDRTEMWVCIPVNGSGVAYPTLAFVWNWTENAWTVRDLPGCPHIGIGLIDESGVGTTFDDLTGTFDERAGIFDERLYTPTSLRLLGCDASGTLFQKFDSTNQKDGSDFTSYIERTDLAINGLRGGEITVDPNTIKFVRRVYPKMSMDAGGTATIKIGGQQYPGGPVTWKTHTFDPNSQTYFSTRVQGKLLAYHVQSATAHQWKLFSMGFDMDVVGGQ